MLFQRHKSAFWIFYQVWGEINKVCRTRDRALLYEDDEKRFLNAKSRFPLVDSGHIEPQVLCVEVRLTHRLVAPGFSVCYWFSYLERSYPCLKCFVHIILHTSQIPQSENILKSSFRLLFRELNLVRHRTATLWKWNSHKKTKHQKPNHSLLLFSPFFHFARRQDKTILQS